MVSINLNDQAIPFPSTWNELTPIEMELAAAAIINDKEDIYHIKFALLIAMISHRAEENKIDLPENWAKQLDPEDVVMQGIECVNFIFDTNDRTVNPYPVIEVKYGATKKIPFHGPANDFDDITCAELADAEYFFHQWDETKDAKHLVSIIAIFWRVAHFKDELLPRKVRFPYEEKRSEAYRNILALLKPQQIMAMFIFITGCRRKLPEYFPLPYGKPTKGEGEADPASFVKCIHAGAGVKNGTRDNIRAMLAKEFLFDMQLEAEKALEQEKQFKAAQADKPKRSRR